MKQKYRRLGKLKAEKLISQLKKIRRASTMKTACFGFDDRQLTRLIKEETRIWRDSWITSPLDEIIWQLEDIYNLSSDEEA